MATITTEPYAVMLHNLADNGAACGYGRGDTHSLAVDAALYLAQERDERAYYDPTSDTVYFRDNPIL